ncbi:MAG: SCO family protein [Gammaproteobacteria bacterium]|nr:MAG: SCO family protein [Gammaproteobacteria bacterium]
MAELTQQQRRGVRRTIIIIVAFIALAIAGFVNKILHPRALNEAEMKLNGAVVLKTPRTPSAFALVDSNGQPFTQDSLKGHWTLLFFGYASCPDVCPTTLFTLGQWYRQMQEHRYGEDLRIVMVSVDPARDTPQVLKPYVAHFHPDFLGVTGEFLTIHKFAREMGVAFQKVPGGTEADYMMDHSSQLVLVNPYGDFHAFFKPTDITGPLPAFKPEQLSLTYKSIRVSF